MPKWAVNIQRGCSIQNDDIGEIPSLTAIPITDRQANIAKHLRGVIVFEKIAGIDVNKAFENYKGTNLNNIERLEKKMFNEARTYESFMKEFKDPKVASIKWNEYKKSLGFKEDVKTDDKPNNN